MAWSGFYWLRIVAGEGLSWTRYWVPCKRGHFLDYLKKSLASQGLCSMEFLGLLVC